MIFSSTVCNSAVYSCMTAYPFDLKSPYAQPMRSVPATSTPTATKIANTSSMTSFSFISSCSFLAVTLAQQPSLFFFKKLYANFP